MALQQKIDRITDILRRDDGISGVEQLAARWAHIRQKADAGFRQLADLCHKEQKPL